MAPPRWYKRWAKRPANKKHSRPQDENSALTLLKSSFRGVSDSLDSVPAPGLQGVIKGILFIMDNMDAASQNLDDFRDLGKAMMSYKCIFEEYWSSRLPAALKEAMTTLSKDIQESCRVVDRIVAHGRARRILESSEDAQLFKKQLRIIEQALKRFQVATSSYTSLVASEFLEINRRLLVDSLLYEEGASFNSPERAHVSASCLYNTRIPVRKRIKEWIFQEGGPPVFWLSGMAGTGKSTVAQSIAEYCDSDGFLAGHFFFSRDILSRHSGSKFFSTLARQLGEFDLRLAPHLADLLRREPTLSKDGLERQFQLLPQSLLALEKAKASLSFPMVVVIDALDECSSPDEVKRILSLLLGNSFQGSDGKRPLLKFFITSRPEPHIQEAFDRALNGQAKRFLHHDLNRDNVDDDIKVYFQHGFEEIRRSRPEGFKSRPKQWPDQYTLKALVQRSKGLFIYASTILKFVGDKRQYPVKQLRIAISLSPGASTDVYSALDRLYAQTLTQDPCYERVQAIVGSIVLVKRALSVAQLEALLELEEGEARVTLQWLRSVLITPPNDEEPVRLFHRSFHDFITTQSRSGDLYVDPTVHHGRLARSCTAVVLKGWPAWVREPQHARYSILRYACHSWSFHLARCGRTDMRCFETTASFIQSSVRLWFDAMIALELLGELGIAIMDLLRSDLQVLYPEVMHFVCEEMDRVGVLLAARYEHLRYANALRVAENLHEQAIGFSGSASHVPLFHLAQVKRRLFQSLKYKDSLTEALKYFNQILQSLPEDHPDRAPTLAEKAICLRLANKPKEVDESFDVFQVALALMPDDDPNKPAYFNSHALACVSRFETGEDASDLDRAIEQYRNAIHLSGSSTSKCIYLNNLGRALQLRFQRDGDTNDIEEALECASIASKDKFTSPSVAFKAAFNYAMHKKFLNQGDLLSALLEAVDRSQLLMWPTLPDSVARKLIQDSEACAHEAAAEAITKGELGLGIYCIEQARTTYWLGGISIRKSYFQLEDDAIRARELAEKLEGGGSEEPLGVLSVDRPVWEESEERGQDVHDYYALLRAGPNHRTSLSDAARTFIEAIGTPNPDDCIIYLNATSMRCDALVLRPGHDPRVVSIPLKVDPPTLQSVAADTKNVWNPVLHKKPSRTDTQILQFLWDMIVNTIIKALKMSPSDDPPRVWWCPSGLFTDLPFHAASDFTLDTPDYATNYMVSSYLPTLQSFKPPFRRSQITPSTNKLVFLDGPVGLYDQPKTEEFQALVSILPSDRLFAVRSGGFSLPYLLEQMHLSAGVHAASRIEQRNEDPSTLRLTLPDGTPIVLNDFREGRNLPGFMFLSTYPDLAGWATGPITSRVGYDLFNVGFPSVIAQQSPMSESEAILMATHFYEEVLQTGELVFTDAAKALHLAGIKLRDSMHQRKPWVRYIHIGM